MKGLLCILLALFLSGQALAQSARDNTTPENGAAQSGSSDYEPYAEDEFPDWLEDVRRAEVVFIGSFPLTMLFTSLTFEGVRAILNAVAGGDTSGNQGFGNEGFTPEETKWILVSGGILSAAVAVVDFILGRVGVTESE
jgi:hypothetical protein